MLLLGGVRDSKQLSEMQREEMFDQVAAHCLRWSIGAASALECDQLGMVAAQRLATARGFAALAGVSVDVASVDVASVDVASVDAAIVDGRWDFVAPHAREVMLEVKADADWCINKY